MESSAAVAGWAGGGAAVGDGAYSGQSGYGEYGYQAPIAQPGAGYGETGTRVHPPPVGSDPPYKRVKSLHGESVGGGEGNRDESGGGYGSELGYGEAPPGSGYDGSGAGMVQPSGVPPSGPPGVSDVQSYGASAAETYGVSDGQSYAASGVQSYGGYAGSAVQSYGAGYEYQQYPAYGSGAVASNYQIPQSFPQVPQHSGPVGAATGPGAGRGKGLMNLFYKTKLCTKFKSGMCAFNENCTFAHGVEELRMPPPGWEQMISGGGASAGRAGGPNSASGQGGQRSTFKTRMCRYFLDGNCPYGDRCNFLHGIQDQQNNPGTENTELQRYGGGTVLPEVAPGAVLTAPVVYGTEGDLLDSHNKKVGSDPTSVSTLSSQANANGTAGNYGYWNEGNKWDGASFAVTQPAVYAHGYSQPNQTGPWMVDYSLNQAYSAGEGEAGVSQYSNQQPQNVSLVRGGSVHDYANQKEDANSAYVQDDVQNRYQEASRNGGSGYIQQGGYSDINYPGQQADYSSSY
eukprot:c28531_g1_i2 orf=668-2212(-)